MDSLPAHKSAKVDQLIQAAGARLLRLPPYSSDFNRIEQAISKIKSVLKKLAHRSVDGMYDGIADALGSIRPPMRCITSPTQAIRQDEVQMPLGESYSDCNYTTSNESRLWGRHRQMGIPETLTLIAT